MLSTLLAISVAFANAPQASDPHAAPHAAPAAHHMVYTADDDSDGMPNWLDDPSGGRSAAQRIAQHAINLGFFALVLLYFRVPRTIGDWARTRALGIRKELVDSSAARDTADARARETISRLADLESEVARLHSVAKTQGSAEADLIVERARNEARRIAESAERTVRDEVARARTRLRQDAVDLAIQLAERVLADKARSDDDERLAHDLLRSVRETR